MNTTGRSLSRPDGYERLLPVIPGDSSLFTRDLAYEDEGQGELIDLMHGYGYTPYFVEGLSCARRR